MSGLASEWLMMFLISRTAQSQIHSAKVDVARANFSLADAADLVVPLPPAREQERIILEAQLQLSIAGVVGADVVRAIARVVRLRQAVLKWAFEGRLVDQDRADEPADRLLDRIRTERAAPFVATSAKESREHAARGAA
jgi:type I restriction enzyme S subunit